MFRKPKPLPSLYLIGSMRNPQVPIVAQRLRAAGFDVFDEWFAPGPEADEKWQEYEQARGRSYIEALQGAHARNVFEFDVYHLKRCDRAVLLLPAGKSAHLELGWMLGQGKPGYILLGHEPIARYDVMTQFATGIFPSTDSLIVALKAGHR